MKKYPVIIDTDPGTDDAVALLTARAEGLCVVAAASVFGNVNSTLTHKNLVNLCGLLGLETQIIRGAQKPLSGDGYCAAEVHGENGIGGCCPPNAYDNSESGDFEILLYDKLKKCGQCDYITLGPLTNLARLITRYPKSIQHIRTLTVMGAGFSVSNIPNGAEFNIGCDPTAAKIVLTSGIETYLIPLDVTHKICLDKAEVEYITGFSGRTGGTKPNEILSDIMYYNYYSSVGKSDDGALIHDATAVMVYCYPEKFSGIKATVSVDGFGKTTMTDGGNTTVYLEADRGFVVEKLKECYNFITEH